MFRLLRADEIEVRVGTVKEDGSGGSLLLYKDARCDMNILDETFGVLGWQRNHEVIDGQLFCNVMVYDDKKGWIVKQDVGTESYTEKEKGRASDSFKRACFNLGIGRELYTAPFIWINDKNCKDKKNWRYKKFRLKEITYNDRKIDGVVIEEYKNYNWIEVYNNMNGRHAEEVKTKKTKVTTAQIQENLKALELKGKNKQDYVLIVQDLTGKSNPYDMTSDDYNKVDTYIRSL